MPPKSKRMSELMIPIDNQIMMCDDRGELIMFASAMLAGSRQIFLANLGAESTLLLFREVVMLLEEEVITEKLNKKANKNAKSKGPKDKGSYL